MSKKRKRDSRPTGRREFLKGVLVGSGAAAVALASGGARGAAKPAPASVKKPDSQGYHVTPHILDYYKTAQL